MSKEYCAVDDENEVDDLAAEFSHVTDHYELIGIVDRLAERTW